MSYTQNELSIQFPILLDSAGRVYTQLYATETYNAKHSRLRICGIHGD